MNDDKSLIERLWNGDEFAWSEMVTRYENLLMAKARSWCKDEHVARDLVQEAFLKACRPGALKNVISDEHLRCWLLLVLQREIKQKHRQDQRRIPCHTGSETPPEGEDRAHSPPDRAILNEMVEGWLKLLPPDQADVLQLKVRGHTTSEIAAILKIPQGTVGSRLHRAERQLKELLCPPDN